MQRSFLTRTLICVIPTLVATALVIWAYLKDPENLSGFKRGIDLSGGTILVYEVDRAATELSRAADTSNSGQADNALAAALKRRIDPTDLLAVVVRPAAGNTRVEVIVPYRAQTEEGQASVGESEVERIKGLIREVGSLEFRILANDMDDGDREALDAARDFLRRAQENPLPPNATPEDRQARPEAAALYDAAVAGVPPQFPRRGPDDAPFIYKNEEIRYEWIELSKHSRADQFLSTFMKDEERQGDLYRRLTTARGNNELVVVEGSNEHGRMSTVYYSRPTLNAKIDQAEREAKQFDYFVLSRVSDRNRLLVGGDVTITANVAQGRNGEPAVGFTFNSRGGEKFYQITYANQPESPTGGGVKTVRQLAIILDGRLISSPSLNEPIRTQGQISGRFERTEVERIVSLLRSGALPATLKPLPVSENTIAATLGRDTIRSGTLSIMFAFIAVLAFMIVYYRFAGLVATIALLANLLLTVGFMVAVNATFTLPGMAGLVLMLGMAVDANVLIYERVREERDRGMNLPTAIRNGYDRALPTIIDTHLSSIFTCIVLYTVGNDQLKGFAVSLTVGLVISLFTSLVMTRLIFDYWQSKNWLTQLRMLRLFSRPSIDFMKYRRLVYTITGVLTVLGIGLFLMRGTRGLNVDFVGGTAYSGRLARPLEVGALRGHLSSANQEKRLKVTEAVEIADPTGKLKNTYELTYDDGTKTIVGLANVPEGPTPQDRAEVVKARASILPDWSVEQIFSGVSTSNESDLFTVRTTERERELVETAISRLMVDIQPDGSREELLAKNRITEITPEPNGDHILTFEKPASRTAVSTLFERQFQVRIGNEHSAASVFELLELGDPEEGRHKQMRLKILKNANAGIQNLIAANELDSVIQAARSEFGRQPQPERLETFDGTLASETQNRALYAIVASWMAILLYLWFRFGNWTFGAAAVICLIHDLCFTLGVIAFCHYIHDTHVGQLLGLKDFKIDLPAVAALLTLVGYSVNDTIVVFDRIKEVRGKSPVLTTQMINDSVNQTLSRTILASLTTFLVVIVLYVFGGEVVKLFAFVMVVGVIIGTLSSIYVASPLLLLFGEGRGRGPVAMSGSSPAAPAA